MATVSAQAVPDTGVTLTQNAATPGGDTITLDPGSPVSVLLVTTAGTGATVTLTTRTPDAYGNAITAKAVVVATNITKAILMPYNEYANASSQCAISWSATTSVTFAVIR